MGRQTILARGCEIRVARGMRTKPMLNARHLPLIAESIGWVTSAARSHTRSRANGSATTGKEHLMKTMNHQAHGTSGEEVEPRRPRVALCEPDTLLRALLDEWLQRADFEPVRCAAGEPL